MTAPLHCSIGILLGRLLPPWASISLCLLLHPALDFYPEYTGAGLGKKLERGGVFFEAVEIVLVFAIIVMFILYHSWGIFWCLVMSVLPDGLEALWQGVTKAGWDRPLFFFHKNSWQKSAMDPINCGVLELVLFSLFSIGAMI